jgi:hypothetical protein
VKKNGDIFSLDQMPKVKKNHSEKAGQGQKCDTTRSRNKHLQDQEMILQNEKSYHDQNE